MPHDQDDGQRHNGSTGDRGDKQPQHQQRKHQQDSNDCNPMHKRIQGEIVSRRRRTEPIIVDGEELASMDRKAVFALKPEMRFKWMTKALRQAEEGKMNCSVLYDIFGSSRFAEEVPPKLGKKMARALQSQGLPLFSAKQQRFIIGQAEIMTRFSPPGVTIPIVLDSERNGGKATSKKKEKAGPIDMEAMMARCQAFVQEKQHERGEREPGIEEAAADAIESLSDLPTVDTLVAGHAPSADASPDRSEAKSRTARKDKSSQSRRKTKRRRSRSRSGSSKRRSHKKRRDSTSSSSASGASGSANSSGSRERKKKKEKKPKKRERERSSSASDAAAKETAGTKKRKRSSSSSSESSRRRKDRHKKSRK